MKQKSVKILILLLLVAFLFTLTGCGDKKQVDDIDDNYRVFYEIFVGSFSDSDGDGCGDLRGIINRMDYLNDGDVTSGKSLGIQGIWLSPVFQSPSYHKYDAADYYQVDEKFGTEEDLKELIDLCHKRNVKVILDLVINHTSNANLMFTKFTNAHKANDKNDEYYDFYVHCNTAEKSGGHSYNLIPGCTDDYYECNFSTDMPELNFDHEAVRDFAVQLAKYYLDLGVDGFRFDAVKYIYYSNTTKSAEFWNWYMEELQKIKEDIYCVGECWSGEGEIMEYIPALNCFNFQMAQSEGFIASAAKGGYMSIFTNYVENHTKQLQEKREDAMMIPFISNHDMDRASGYLTLATGRMHMAANLYLLCSGSPFLYYGEEIGMRGTRGAANTDANRRLAMNWGDGDTVSDPIGTTYEKKKQTNGTAAEHLANETSLYYRYSRLISLRNKYPEIARGEYKSIAYDTAQFGGFLISYQDKTTGLFHNTSDSELTIDLKNSLTIYEYDFAKVCDFIGQGTAQLNGIILTIGPQTSVILQ